MSAKRLRFKDISRSYFRQAQARLQTAGRAYTQRNYPYCVRQAQESAELELKAALRLMGVEYPKVHDVSDALQSNRHLFPETFQLHIDELVKLSRELARERSVAMYGEEARGLPPEKIFDKQDAKKALDAARKVLKACRTLT